MFDWNIKIWSFQKRTLVCLTRENKEWKSEEYVWAKKLPQSRGRVERIHASVLNPIGIGKYTVLFFSNKEPWNSVPKDIFLKILNYCSFYDLIMFYRVCKTIKRYFQTASEVIRKSLPGIRPRVVL